MKKTHFLTTISLLLISTVTLMAQTPKKPKLVLQVVVSQMRYDYLSRFGDNFSPNGLRKLMDSAACFENAHYGYMQTNTVAGLSTLVTGSNPSQHGVMGENWIDFTTGNRVNLIADQTTRGLDCDDSVGRYSPRQLTVSTLGDRLKESDSLSKVLSIASSPASAIVAGGFLADVYWMDEGRGDWISSNFYFSHLPLWVKEYNKTKPYELYTDRTWAPSLPKEQYKNRDATLLSFESTGGFFGKDFFKRILHIFKSDDNQTDVMALQYTPFGNSLTTQFAREAILREALGGDEHTDLLTVCYDTPRYVSERFGPRSVELEDTYYKLDEELGELLAFVASQFKSDEVLVVFTSDHGSSDTFKEGNRVPMGRFNVEQFKMIMNGFLSAQFEPGNWVLDYQDRQLYLNREIIYTYGFNLAEVQTRAAAFALQFRGVSGALTSTSMQNGYFGKGYAEKVQNSFYPKRAGDLTISLMPGWIEEDQNKVSLSGSLYDYDTHVPLFIYGAGLTPQSVERGVEMIDVAPTLARMMELTVPNAATGVVIPEVLQK